MERWSCLNRSVGSTHPRRWHDLRNSEAVPTRLQGLEVARGVPLISQSDRPLPEVCRADAKEYAFPGVQLFAYLVSLRALTMLDNAMINCLFICA